MNGHTLVWGWLFLALTAALLLAPLYPAWKEWHAPRDEGALALVPMAPAAEPLAVAHWHLTADMPIRPLREATHSILALPGCRFEKLKAPCIDLGARDSGVIRTATRPGDARCVELQDLPHASAWGAGGWRVNGDCRIPAAHRLRGPLVVMGDLSVEHDCLIDGDVKAHGDIRVAPYALITGALVGDSDMALDRGCRVHGPVVCEKHLSLGRSVVLGQAHQATSVSAQSITTQAGVRVHGSIWAHKSGKVA